MTVREVIEKVRGKGGLTKIGKYTRAATIADRNPEKTVEDKKTADGRVARIEKMNEAKRRNWKRRSRSSAQPSS